uniref:CUB domain-containing protein n=1 Tax=Plectus sambesii TaxID=2011161 RepID=A0A914XC54_9BILA
MIQNLIFCFVLITGVYQQTSAVLTQNKLAVDNKNFRQLNTGFNVQTDTSDCQCPNNVSLNENNWNVTVLYPKVGDLTGPSNCCKNANCVLVISAPPGYQLKITSGIQFQNVSSASLTIRNGNGNNGYMLGRLDIKTTFGTFLSAANAMTVTFSTDNTASDCGNSIYTVIASLKQLPTPSSPYLLSSDQPSQLITKNDLSSSDQYWTITAEPGKQVHLYLFGSFSSSYRVNIFVVDGADVNGKLIAQVTQLSYTYGPQKILSSSGGSLTVLLQGETSFYATDLNFLFTQLENDPSQCGTSDLAFLTSENSPAVPVQINSQGGGTASCQVVLITSSSYATSLGMKMTISTLQGGMALYGGLESRPASNTEIISFSSMNDVISPMIVAGNIFLVQLKPGTTISLNFETSTYNSGSVIRGGSGAKGLMMSENFPYLNKKEIADSFSFYGDGIDYYEYSINVLRYDLGSGSLTIKSTVLDSDFSKTLTGTGSNTPVHFCTNSFEADYTSNGINQKGFVLRYDVGTTCSNGLSTAWIWIIVSIAFVAITAAAMLFGFLLRRRLLQSQRNNTSYTAQPVYFVPSQPSEVNAPPSYMVIQNQGAPTTSFHNQVEMKTS